MKGRDVAKLLIIRHMAATILFWMLGQAEAFPEFRWR